MKPLVILAGPTAVGKTELSIRLAKRIVTCDEDINRFDAGLQIHGHWLGKDYAG